MLRSGTKRWLLICWKSASEIKHTHRKKQHPVSSCSIMLPVLSCLLRGLPSWEPVPSLLRTLPLSSIHLWVYSLCFQEVWWWSVVEKGIQTLGSQDLDFNPTSSCFPSCSDSKESAICNVRPRFDPWVGRSPGEGSGNPLQYSCLENFMDRRAWWV